MFTIFSKKWTGGSPLSCTYQFRLKPFIGVGRQLSNKNLVAGNTLFWIGFLKNEVPAVKTEIGLCVIATKG